MIDVRTLRRKLQLMSAISDWKFALGLHVRFANPTLLYQTYPQEWIDFYTANGLVFRDPTVRWAMTHTGICDWSELAEQDESNVFGQAAEFGLRYGKAVAVGDETRSAGFFAHPSRRIEQAEVEEAHALLKQLHDMTKGVELMPAEELKRLRAELPP